jgi:hypothetical protein
MSKLLIPNTCQVPNVLLDEIMPRIGGVALKVLLAIVRQTYGFGVPSRQIGLKKLSQAYRTERAGCPEWNQGAWRAHSGDAWT